MKELKQLTKEELQRRIIFSNLQEISNTAERMTSGNFMHNKASIELMVKNITIALNKLNIYEI